MLGTIVNSIAIVIGSLFGKVTSSFASKHAEALKNALALCVLLVGIQSAIGSDNLIIVIIAIAVGTLIGEIINIEHYLERLGQRLESMTKNSEGIAQSFVAGTLLFCIGSMAIIGSLESGIMGKHDTLFAKSILDGITSMIFASTLGIGVMFSAISVFVYQGTLTLLASWVAPYLQEAVIANMTGVGGLLIIGLAINMLEIKTIKVGNMLPSIFLPILLAFFF